MMLNYENNVSRAPLILLLAFFAALSGCSNIEHKPKEFLSEAKAPPYGPLACSDSKKIAIFFDGTANDEGSDTNVKRMHSLVTLQNKGNIATLYIQGVGVNNDLQGAISGGGINARVKIAYEFILNNYQPLRCKKDNPDEIYIFGFSRGAYSARILTTMLYYGGFVRSEENTHSNTELAELVHDTVFGPVFRDVAQATRLKDVKSAYANKKVSAGESGNVEPIPVKVLGLWDTVEALGPQNFFPSTVWVGLQPNFPKVNIDSKNGRYGERLCNVEKAYHAVSLDDNRATIFTPLLLTRKHLFIDCQYCDGTSPMLDKNGRIRENHLKEVWFSGAHSDVGGGYLDSSLNGVSLNWMIEQLKGTNLLPDNAAVRQDVYGSSHNPRSGLWALLYPNVNRNIVEYALRAVSSNDEEAPYEVKAPRPEFAGSICVHPSVFQRRKLIRPKQHEYLQLALKSRGVVPLVLNSYHNQPNWNWLVEQNNGVIGSESLIVLEYPDCPLQIEVEPK